MDANRDPESCSKWIFKKANNASITLRYQIVHIPDLGFFESYRKPKTKKTKKKKKRKKERERIMILSS
jgi:hypothetical protein